jgi:hypothetical protein
VQIAGTPARIRLKIGVEVDDDATKRWCKRQENLWRNGGDMACFCESAQLSEMGMGSENRKIPSTDLAEN